MMGIVKFFLRFVLAAMLPVGGCSGKASSSMSEPAPEVQVCADRCVDQSKTPKLSCKLTTTELRERKETVLANLKMKVSAKRQLINGYAFRFEGSDETLDQLTEFIKAERECCDFFSFGLTVSGDKSEAWLQLTGPDGTKDFIGTELGL